MQLYGLICMALVSFIGVCVTVWLAVQFLGWVVDRIVLFLKLNKAIIGWFFHRKEFEKWMEKRGGMEQR